MGRVSRDPAKDKNEWPAMECKVNPWISTKRGWYGLPQKNQLWGRGALDVPSRDRQRVSQALNQPSQWKPVQSEASPQWVRAYKAMGSTQDLYKREPALGGAHLEILAEDAQSSLRKESIKVEWWKDLIEENIRRARTGGWNRIR